MINEKEQFWIWLAGFIDGEGCIYLTKSKNKLTSNGFQITLRLEIAQSDKELLEYLKEKVGAGSNIWNKSRERYYIGINGNKHHSNKSYALKLSANKALFVLEKIYPYSKVKKEQIRLAIEFQKKMGYKNWGRRLFSWAEQLAYLQKIKELKIIAP